MTAAESTNEHGPGLLTPEWTAAQTRDALTVLYGFNHNRTGPDTAAVARAHGVSRRTVQRWLHTTNADAVSVPSARLDQIRTEASPLQHVLDDEASKRRYAQRAVERIVLPHGQGHTGLWQKQGWLDRHLLVILAVPGYPLHRATVTKLAEDTTRRLRSRGDLVNFAAFANKFSAALAKADLLEQVGPWRVCAPPDSGVIGRTATWLASAPLPDLDR